MELKQALERIRDTAKTFKGGTQLTPENRDLMIQELADYTEARRVAQELGATEYQMSLAMTGKIFVY